MDFEFADAVHLLAVEEFTKPDEGVTTFTPVYHPFYLAVEHSHRTLVESTDSE